MPTTVTLFAGVGPARAEGWEIGFSGGRTRTSIDPKGRAQLDGDGSTLHLWGGYRFNRAFGLDFGFVDLGKSVPRNVGSSGIAARGWNVGVLGVAPLGGRFAFEGRGGLFVWDGRPAI